MSRTTQSTLEKLQRAIHGVTAPFSCAGTFDADKPITFVFKDRSRLEIVRAKNDFEQTPALQPLLDQCRPAPFGDGKRTRYDARVRDALQLKAENKGFAVEHFDPESAGILKQIQQELLPHDPNPISAELYTVNVYMPGGHFAPHKDTPRGDDMFGTLVVCLPSQFWRGQLVLSHRGVVQKFDWASTIAKQKNPNELHWVAFFGDVDHQIERIGGGARVTLTYLLRRGNGAPMREIEGADLAPRIQEAWQALLADKSFLPNGGTVGYPCCHLYHQDARFQREQKPIDPKSSTVLKGRDQLVAATALQAGLTVTFNPYMFENCVDETWQLERFPTRQEAAKLGWQVEWTDLESALPIRARAESAEEFGVTWLEPPPSSDVTTWQSREDRDPELPAASKLHHCDYCPWGYFGNESGEVDFYTFAALHIDIPKFGKGPRAAAKPMPRKTAKRAGSSRKGKAK